MSLYYGYLQWNNYIGDPDGFYHAKITLFLRKGILLKELPWMQFSTLNNNFTDHHFLYHLILIPFTYLNNNPLITVKIAAVFFTITMVLVFYWLLKKLSIAYPFIFTLLFITLTGASYRLMLIKVNSLSLLLIWVLIYALFKQKTWLITLLGFIFVWLYGGWPLAILITLIYILTDRVYSYYHTKKIKVFWSKIINIIFHNKKPVKNIKIILSLLLGIISGLIINPYWPHNIYFYYQQIIQIGIVNFGNKFAVGGEWYGSSIMQVISSAPHIFILAIILLVLLIFNYNKIDKKSIFSFILTFIFLLLTIKSKRYVEYYLPFSLLFVACGFTNIKNVVNKKKIKKVIKELPNYLKIYLIIVFSVFIILILPNIIHKTIDLKINDRWEMDKFKETSEWIKNNIPSESIIFHADWDEWPLLFYHNDSNYYMIGLDPTFMYNYDKDLQELYISITKGEIGHNLSRIIKESFNSNYIFLETSRHKMLKKRLDKDLNTKLIYNNGNVNVYKIK